MNLKPLKILGVMSGTSVDGLDLALCKFGFSKGKWYYKLIQADTIPYTQELKKQFFHCMEMKAHDLVKLDHEYGTWIGEKCSEFLGLHHQNADLIASHGHTVFHNPLESYTLQIGDGHDIASNCSIPVIYNFRSMDIALGGQGAPMVPIGDDLLFGDYNACLNLGGFSNISYRLDNIRIAFDICPVNIALNHLTRKINQEYDQNGITGRTGVIIPELFERLENISYFSAPPPKSLGKEWLKAHYLPLLESYADLRNILRTLYEHISNRIAAVTSIFNDLQILVTGGGAHNSFLMELIREKSSCNYVLPDRLLIDYKEAIIFGFLGYLRYFGLNNTLRSVTGAKRDSCGGLIVIP